MYIICKRQHKWLKTPILGHLCNRREFPLARPLTAPLFENKPLWHLVSLAFNFVFFSNVSIYCACITFIVSVISIDVHPVKREKWLKTPILGHLCNRWEFPLARPLTAPLFENKPLWHFVFFSLGILSEYTFFYTLLVPAYLFTAVRTQCAN